MHFFVLFSTAKRSADGLPNKNAVLVHSNHDSTASWSAFIVISYVMKEYEISYKVHNGFVLFCSYFYIFWTSFFFLLQFFYLLTTKKYYFDRLPLSMFLRSAQQSSWSLNLSTFWSSSVQGFSSFVLLLLHWRPMLTNFSSLLLKIDSIKQWMAVLFMTNSFSSRTCKVIYMNFLPTTTATHAPKFASTAL